MDKEILKAYLNGTCTEEQRLSIEQWLLEDPTHVQLLESMLPPVNSHVDKAAVRKRLQNTMRPVRVMPALTAWRVAAAVLLIAVCSSIIYVMLRRDEPLYKSTMTAYGQRRQVALDDSTSVTLNGSSKMDAPEHFAEDTREVTLQGEAFFQVKRDERRPFIIHSGSVTVEVLGTSFNVRSYEAESEVMVTVSTGKVRVTHSDSQGSVHEVILTPGQQIVINKQTYTLDQRSVSVEQFTAWKDGYLRFRNVSLGEIFQSLEKIYKITILPDNTLDMTQRLTLNQREGAREETFKVLAAMAGFDYTFRNDSLVVVNRKGGSGKE